MSNTNKTRPAPQIGPRESVILAEDYTALVAWYQSVLGLRVLLEASNDYHFTQLVNDAGINIGIAMASEMGVKPGDRSRNAVVLQFEVEDVKAFFTHLASCNVKPTFGPSFDKNGNFWFGGFADGEGNPCWVVDKNCP